MKLTEYDRLVSDLPQINAKFKQKNFLHVEEDDRHFCYKCHIAKPIVECKICYKQYCNGCIQYDNHDKTHKLTFLHKPSYNLNNASVNDYVYSHNINENNMPEDINCGKDYFNKYNSSINYSNKNKNFELCTRENCNFDEYNSNQLHNYLSHNTLTCNDEECIHNEKIDVKPKFQFKKAFKSVAVNNDAYNAYSQSLMICKTCDYLPFAIEKDDHKVNKHETIKPEVACKELQEILQSFSKNFPAILERNGEAQYTSVQLKNKVDDIRKNIIQHIKNSGKILKKAVESNRKQICKAIDEVFKLRADDIELVDTVLYKHKLKLDAFSETLIKLASLGKNNKAAAINGWRLYEREIRSYDFEQTQKNGKALLYNQCASYLDSLEQSIRNSYKSITAELQKIRLISEESINKITMSSDQIKFNLIEEKLVQIESLKDSQMLQTLMNIPVVSKLNTAINTMSYTSNYSEAIMADYFYRIDTFHANWERVYVAIYQNNYIAIYSKLDTNNSIQLGFDQKVRGYQKNAKKIDPNQLFKTPPENLLPLNELHIAQLLQTKADSTLRHNVTVSPIGLLLEKTLNIPAIELIRVSNNSIQGWWVLSSESADKISKWYLYLTNYANQQLDDSHAFPYSSSKYTPSTNPAINIESLGIIAPPIGDRWAATHLAQVKPNMDRKLELTRRMKKNKAKKISKYNQEHPVNNEEDYSSGLNNEQYDAENIVSNDENFETTFERSNGQYSNDNVQQESEERAKFNDDRDVVQDEEDYDINVNEDEDDEEEDEEEEDEEDEEEEDEEDDEDEDTEDNYETTESSYE